jgi:hypothetical protein
MEVLIHILARTLRVGPFNFWPTLFRSLPLCLQRLPSTQVCVDTTSVEVDDKDWEDAKGLGKGRAKEMIRGRNIIEKKHNDGKKKDETV